MIIRKNQKGLSLVELMVAMVLGLIISAAVLELFLTNRQTFVLQQGTASVLEQGQFAVDFLSKELMAAGHGDVEQVVGVENGESTNGGRYDAIRIFMVGGKDCSGADEEDEEDAPVDVLWKHYSVAEQNGTGVLRCTDSDGNDNPLIDNVDAFEILYGVSTDVNNASPNYYATIDRVVANDHSNNIVSIRFAILIASDGATNMDGELVGQHGSDPQSMQVLDREFSYTSDGGNYSVDFEDRRLRRLFVSTVALRNVAGG